MAINIQVALHSQMKAENFINAHDWRLQLAIIASATVHVIAHGGMSYALMFASIPHASSLHSCCMLFVLD
jgi:hypothetical protein